MTESVVYCHQISQEIMHMQSKFSTAYRRDAQFPSWPLPETLGRVFLTFLPFSDTLFTLHYFLQVFMCVGVHSGIPHMPFLFFSFAFLSTIRDNGSGRAGLSYLWHLNCGGNVQHMLEMLLYSNVWPMALHLYEHFYQQRDPKERY